jgi:hypothetical protein
MTYPSDLNDAQWEQIQDHFNTGNYGKNGSPKQVVILNYNHK